MGRPHDYNSRTVELGKFIWFCDHGGLVYFFARSLFYKNKKRKTIDVDYDFEFNHNGIIYIQIR